MRVALKIAYDGRDFHGHQRQPVDRTVEGECLAALKAARILADPREAFFRSASRTDRGVSAVGNVIAFNTDLQPEGALGAFNDKARQVGAGPAAEAPADFHPRHAIQRWYRYHGLEPVPLPPLRAAARCFVGQHDLRWFTSDPPQGLWTLDRVDVTEDGAVTCIDVRARSFRRGMIRRVVAALLGHAQGDVSLESIRAALRGERHDFGMAPAAPLTLMDVRYDVKFRTLLKPKVLGEWDELGRDLFLRQKLFEAIHQAVASPLNPPGRR